MDIVVNEDLIGDEDEAEIAEWAVADGAVVSVGDVIGSLETSKVQMDLEAPAAGVIHLKVAVGDVIPAGTVIASIS